MGGHRYVNPSDDYENASLSYLHACGRKANLNLELVIDCLMKIHRTGYFAPHWDLETELHLLAVWAAARRECLVSDMGAEELELF